MEKRVEERPIREVMTPAPVTVTPMTPLAELQEVLERHDYNALPVVDDTGLLLGMVTSLDLLAAFRPNRRRSAPGLETNPAERVEHVMRRGLVTVGPDDPVVKAVDLMVEQGLHSLPVVVRGPAGPALVGIVSRKDLLRCLTVGGP